MPPATRDEAERADPHPLLAAYQAHRTSKCMSRDEVRRAVIPAYMGLITQIDEQIGVLMRHLEEATRDRLAAALLRWTERLRNRTTMSDARVEALTEIEMDEGIWIEFYDEADIARGKKAPKGRS